MAQDLQSMWRATSERKPLACIVYLNLYVCGFGAGHCNRSHISYGSYKILVLKGIAHNDFPQD